MYLAIDLFDLILFIKSRKKKSKNACSNNMRTTKMLALKHDNLLCFLFTLYGMWQIHKYNSI